MNPEGRGGNRPLLAFFNQLKAQRCDCGYDLTAPVLGAEADFCKGNN